MDAHWPQCWKLTLAYDGTDFHGWQVQPGLRTVQGELQAALLRLTGEEVLPQGSGRTDAGVHALAQVASVVLRAPIPPQRLARALNRTLPPAIRVLAAEHAPTEFHARHSATGKVYEYRIFRTDPGRAIVCPPTLARYAYALEGRLEIEAMQEAVRHLLGRHDFTSFAAVDPDRRARQEASTEAGADNYRTITESEWTESGQLLVYTVAGSGFLHHMVRTLVGTALEVGRGQREAAALPAILKARSRSAAGATAPARGLFLREVRYGE